MARKCRQCGYLNEISADSCELCGGRLDEAFIRGGHPHRVPTGPRKRPPRPKAPPRIRDTQIGFGGLPKPPRLVAEPGAQTDEASVESIDVEDTAPNLLGRTADRPRIDPEARLLGKVKLVVEQGKIIGEQYLLTETRMIIGRVDPEHNSYPDIDLSAQDNDYVHRRHACIHFHDMATRISVEHVGGHNPTLVNNEPVARGELVELAVGDRLRTGRVVMRLTKA